MENYVGKRIDGRYEIHDVVGVGGMAVVYKAYDNIDDRIVAIKILKDEYLANEEFRRRFKNESKAIAVLNHRNIVKVSDVSFGDRLQYIVMEYIEGISLKEYIQQKGAIDWNEALFFSIQILRALQHAHDKGIVHRDVKPQNIMLLENGTIKVTDFGIARFSHGETRTMTEKAIGSVHYISPEQAKGELTDEKADIYSVGIVLYEMLTGKLPFEAESAVSVALMQVNNEAVLPRTINSKIPLGFEQITMKAMQKSTRERYQTAAEMLLDLEELKRNPNIKFDYMKYFVDEQPTRFVGKIQDNSNTVSKPINQASASQMVPPVNVNRQRVNPQPSPAVRAGDILDKKQGEGVSNSSKRVAVISVALVAVILFLVVFIIFNLSGGGNKIIEVENFVGLNYEQEIANNEKYKDIYYFQTTYQEYSGVEEGCVFKQDPAPGTEQEKGRTIHLYIAKSGDGVVIPDYSGQNYQTARDALESMGFTVNLVSDTSTDAELSTVIRTDPASGSSVFPGSNVTIYYASSEAKNSFKMPNLNGYSLEEAKKVIAENDLVLGDVKYVDTTAEKDMVIEQSPSPDSYVVKDFVVTLTLSSGKTIYSGSVQLPENIGNATVKVSLDDTAVVTDSVNTSSQSQYSFEVSGNQESRLKVFLNDELYYSATVDFTRDPVKVSDEKFEAITFYVNVVGMDVNAAKATLYAAGYSNVEVVEEVSESSPGVVLRQSPEQSSAPKLDKTAKIVLTVSQKEQPPTETQVDSTAPMVP